MVQYSTFVKQTLDIKILVLVQAPICQSVILSSSYAFMRSAHVLNYSVVTLLPNTRISPPTPNPSPIDLDCTLAAGSVVHRPGTILSARLEALRGAPPPLSGRQPPIQHFSGPKASLRDRLAGPSSPQAPTSHCRVPCCRLPS